MANVTDTIKGQKRMGSGKGEAHKLRAQGLVPTIVYGPGAEDMNLAIDAHTFGLQRRNFRPSHIYDVEVEGTKPFKVLVKEVQRNHMTDEYLHIDLYALDMSKPISVEIRISLKGKAKGVGMGGVLTQTMRTTEIICLPADIPPPIVVDVTDMDVGDVLHLGDITLPEGVKFDDDLKGIVAKLTSAEDEEEEKAEGEAAEAAKA